MTNEIYDENGKLKKETIIATDEDVKEHINDVKKEIEQKEIKAFGRQINMGNITMEDYNAIVKKFGNRFINVDTGAILCACGNFHNIEKKGFKKIIKCPVMGFYVDAATKPKIYEKWIHTMIEFFEEIELYTTKQKEVKNERTNR